MFSFVCSVFYFSQTIFYGSLLLVDEHTEIILCFSQHVRALFRVVRFLKFKKKKSEDNQRQVTTTVGVGRRVSFIDPSGTIRVREKNKFFLFFTETELGKKDKRWIVPVRDNELLITLK